jgi:Asp/Glu/hydantoin racemase
LAKTLALIHTSPTLTPMFTALCSKYMPETEIFHMVDESLIKDTIREGTLRRVTIRRLLALIESANMSGADAVMVTCSSIGPGIAIAQQLFDFPVIRVALLREKAAEAGRDIQIVDSLCDGAFDAVLDGDTTTHDRILSEALVNDMRGVDIVVLAQASMSRVVRTMPEGTLAMPVLSSPELAVKQACEILSRMNNRNMTRTAV